jgi:16S rRNA (cytosine1402-N4)-methyltransferase
MGQYKEDLGHSPVLLSEVVALMPESAATIVDLTVGGAGHALDLLRKNPKAVLWGIDRDPDALERAASRLSVFSDRCRLLRSAFSRAVTWLIDQGVKADYVLADLGVSSQQLSTPPRGFSFRSDGPLDMRMDPEDLLTAANIVNQQSEAELTALFFRYGEEKYARRIARAIVKQRTMRMLATTTELADCIRGAVPAAYRYGRIDPATRTFQALRIAVNDELAELETTLASVPDLLTVGGRLAVIAFHSLEDRLVKTTFQRWVTPCTCPKEIPRCVCNRQPIGRYLSTRRIMPSADETKGNPRSRSARLRIIEKI